MKERTQGTRRHAIVFVALAAALVLGTTTAEPTPALAAPTKSGSKTKAPLEKPERPLAPNVKAKKAPALPVGEARFTVPYKSKAITNFYVWLSADISSVEQVRFEVRNLTEQTPVNVFNFGTENTTGGSVGDGDQVHIVLDPEEDLRHWLSFSLYSDYSGCSSTWDEDEKIQEIWSVRVSGGPYGGPFTAIPLEKVVVGSFDLGDTCSSSLANQVLHCIDPSTSVVVQPNPGTVRSCSKGFSPKAIKTP